MNRQQRRHPERYARVAGFKPSPRRPINVNKGLTSEVVTVGGKSQRVWYKSNKHGEPKRRNDGGRLIAVGVSSL